MASIKVPSDAQSDSYASGAASVSIAGGLTAPHPPRSRARATNLWFEKDHLEVELVDGRTVTIPLDWFPRLRAARRDQLEHYELIGGGTLIRWPDLDEDLSVAGLLRA